MRKARPRIYIRSISNQPDSLLVCSDLGSSISTLATICPRCLVPPLTLARGFPAKASARARSLAVTPALSIPLSNSAVRAVDCSPEMICNSRALAACLRCWGVYKARLPATDGIVVFTGIKQTISVHLSLESASEYA